METETAYRSNPRVLGIDPGYSTGLALVEITTNLPRLIQHDTMKKAAPDDVRRALLRYASARGLRLIVVQSPIFEGRTPIFRRGKSEGSVISVLKNAHTAGLWTGAALMFHLPVIEVPPARRSGAKSLSGVFAREFVIECENKRVSEHARDAAQFAVAAWSRWQFNQRVIEAGS